MQQSAANDAPPGIPPPLENHTAALPKALPKDWVAISFLTLTPLIGVVGTALYTWRVGFAPWMLLLCVGMFAVVGLAVCAGYHRYLSHKTYECSPVVQVFYAVFGALAVQNSIAAWSAGHRRHHQHVDDDWDPYNIKRGFWWAHILWIFYKDPLDADRSYVPDLMKNPIVRWQDRWYKPLLVIGGFGLPALIGAAFGDALAGLLWGGFLRITITHHSTFLVNSLAHHMGDRTYDPHVSACDNWAVALLTLGEGYHSFHHKFPADYRNGIRWYQWDPAKWFIACLRVVGLAEKLRRTPEDRIEAARMKAAVARLQERLAQAPQAHAHPVHERLHAARQSLERALELRLREVQQRAEGLRASMRESRRLARQELRAAREQWQEALRMLHALPLPEPA
jgi:stearoyl-CoA desaturase (delta-9 desaturase)